MKDKAVIENHGWLVCEHICGVPMVTPENDQRWFDNYGGLTCRNFRFGGEFAGFTAVVNKVRYKSTYPVIPSYITMEACHCYCLGNRKRGAFIFCEEIPNQIVVRDCTGFPDLPVLRVRDDLDLDTYFDDAETRGEACLRFLIGPEQVELRLRDLPEQMRPYQVGEVSAEAPPQKGAWHRGAFLRNRQGGALQPYGWTCLEPGKPGKWQPVYFSFTPPGRAVRFPAPLGLGRAARTQAVRTTQVSPARRGMWTALPAPDSAAPCEG
jgi:hypothetical protein